jgi:hypothetical protein
LAVSAFSVELPRVPRTDLADSFRPAAAGPPAAEDAAAGRSSRRSFFFLSREKKARMKI